MKALIILLMAVSLWACAPKANPDAPKHSQNITENNMPDYTPPSSPSFVPARLEAIWAKLPHGAPAEGLKDNESVDRFKTDTGFAFPADLLFILQQNNGDQNFHDYWEFLSAEGVLREWHNWKEIYDDWSEEELTSNNEPDGSFTLGYYTLPYWVPFLSDGGGNFAALDFSPGPGGKPGQVIAFGADEVKIRHLAPSLTDFLEAQANGDDPINRGY